MTTEQYFDNWHRELSELINAARSGTQMQTDVDVKQPKIECFGQNDVIITFRVLTGRKKNWNDRIFMVYSPDRLNMINDIFCITLAESPLPPGLHINCYCPPAILSIQMDEYIVSTIRWEHFEKEAQEIHKIWDNLSNPFELAVVVGYDSEHPTLDPLSDRPTKYQSAWRELNQLLEWQKLAAFVFKVEKP